MSVALCVTCGLKSYSNFPLVLAVKRSNLLVATNGTSPGNVLAVVTASLIGNVVMGNHIDLFLVTTNLTLLCALLGASSGLCDLKVAKLAGKNDIISEVNATSVTLIYVVALIATSLGLMLRDKLIGDTLLIKILLAMYYRTLSSSSGVCENRSCNREEHEHSENQCENLLHCLFHCSSPLKKIIITYEIAKSRSQNGLYTYA
jgi:hypothetical protein